MQVESLNLEKKELGALPLIEEFLNQLRAPEILSEALGGSSYAEAILVLVKNILVEPSALYRVREWAQLQAPELVYGGTIGDDRIGRALDRLFKADRASLMTNLVVSAVKEFKVETDQVHNDSTSVKLHGAFANQKPNALQLLRGHSKDHRPDLKQLVYSLSVSADGAIPVHCKTYDGNTTDDTTHWETWLMLCRIIGHCYFIYVADCKLCVSETLLKIDKAQGKFITILPATRAEVAKFYEEVHRASVRWEEIWSKRSTRYKKRTDVFELAQGAYQMREGFHLYWYRSSEKARRDALAREEKLELALAALNTLNNQKKYRSRTVAAFKRKANKILSKYHVENLLTISFEVEQQEIYKQTTKGKPVADTTYRRIVKQVPKMLLKHNLEAIARSRAIDGIFPLTTNTDLTALDVLKKYKYQPTLEKRHSLFKSTLEVAPVFLKNNTRIEALMLVYFIAQLLAALIERSVRNAMKEQAIISIDILPEERPSKTPSATQILLSFKNLSRHTLISNKMPVKVFLDTLSPIQTKILELLKLPKTIFH